MKQYFFVFCFFCTVVATAQTTQKNSITPDNIISFETMHVHFDKDIYLPGETIWFKAYLYNVNEVSYTATNFYAAIYDDNGKLIQQKQYPIVEGSCNGDFEIPDTIEFSRIQFRAFTKAMIEEDSNNVCQYVLNVYQKNNFDSTAPIKQKTLQFFSEGGQVIAELPNFIGFKALYEDGSTAMINGEIVEVETNKVIDSFSTDNRGIGKLMLMPRTRISYKAVWKDDNGIKMQTPLPAIKRFGVSFHAEVVEKKLQYLMARNRTNDSLSELHLLAQMGNYKVYNADIVLPNEMEMASAGFSIDSIPAGLMQLTLFDKGWNKLQERIVFINGELSKEQPMVKRDTINNLPKGKNTIQISLADTMFTNLSVSIADVNFYDQSGTHSILQDILLNTQLKGLTQNANAFLQTEDFKGVDLLLLSHQWKKFDWEKAINENKTKPVLDNYISLAANYNEKNLTLPPDDALNLIVTNNGLGKQFYNVKPAGLTSFKKSGLVFFDSAKVAYQMDKNKELINYLTIQREEGLSIPVQIGALPKQSYATIVKTAEQNNNFDNFYTTVHKKFNDLQTIKGVVVKSKYKGNPITERIDELDKFYTSGMFGGTTRGFQLNVIDDTLGVAANHDIKNYLRFRLPGLKLYHGVFAKQAKIRRVNNDGSYMIVDSILPVLIFINEVEWTPGDGFGDGLELVTMSDVAYVKYFPGIAIGAGFQTSNGALFVYTKTGREKGPPVKGLPFVYIKGYNAQKEFNSPDYNDKVLAKQPDYRTTVYWNPNVIMDKTNNTFKIEYFNNDISKKLLLKIEGVNAAGKLFSVEKILE
ncbi:hypothetical protein [Ferruginibacter sp. SUN106]|uniref:hypothetical protein n=1 Tax=Ferruginibacter sp. SUN106 TaxID=2978348 RepID=UPI003D364D7F